MSKSTNYYDILKDIQRSVNRVEDKLDRRIIDNTKKIDVVEGKVDNLLGKVGIGIMIVSAFIAGLVSLIFDFFRKKAQ